MNAINAAGNTIVPALLALERLGFKIAVEQLAGEQQCRATRGDESYCAEDPVTVLGLVRLIELRGWNWRASDLELHEKMHRYGL